MSLDHYAHIMVNGMSGVICVCVYMPEMVVRAQSMHCLSYPMFKVHTSL